MAKDRRSKSVLKRAYGQKPRALRNEGLGHNTRWITEITGGASWGAVEWPFAATTTVAKVCPTSVSQEGPPDYWEGRSEWHKGQTVGHRRIAGQIPSKKDFAQFLGEASGQASVAS